MILFDAFFRGLLRYNGTIGIIEIFNIKVNG